MASPERRPDGLSAAPRPSTVDPRGFRQFSGHFLTGVAVVSARDAAGMLHGLTLNAVTSVSLDPPLYLACLDNASNTLRAIQQTGSFGINFLRADQEAIARQFATKAERKFASIRHRRGYLDVPLIEDALASAVCRVYDVHPSGDHHIVIGQLEDYTVTDGAPLIFFKGRFLCNGPVCR